MPQIMDFLFIHFSFASGFACNHLKLYAALVVEAEANYLVNPSTFNDYSEGTYHCGYSR